MFHRPSKKSQNQNQYNQVDSTGRFGIGMAFQADTQPAPAAAPPVVTETAATPSPAAASIYAASSYLTPLRCDLCGVSANRQDQLETHKRGARHLRMLRLNGLAVPETGNIRERDTYILRDNLLNLLIPISVENENVSNVSESIDYSIYRTPSGKEIYTCNI